MKKYSIIIIVIWMIVIFSFSNAKSVDSDRASTKVIYNISNCIFKITNKLNITDIDSNEYATKASKKLNAPMRKVAHAFVYFVLSIICLYVLNIYKVKKYSLYTFLICFIYSISDEIHQLFISGRYGTFKDVLIDSFGCVIGIILFKYIKGDKHEKA